MAICCECGKYIGDPENECTCGKQETSTPSALDAKELERVAHWLFDQANALGGDETGHLAVQLHQASNMCRRVLNEVEED